MPFVNIKLIEGGLSHEERQELIKRVTDAVVSVYGEGVRSVTWVACEDVHTVSLPSWKSATAQEGPIVACVCTAKS